jgi:hypothetical protein
MKCIDCSRPATHLHPYLLCDHCWSERYGTQNVDGVAIPFKKLFRDNLMKRGLWKKDDEEVPDWQDRCKTEAHKSRYFKEEK